MLLIMNEQTKYATFSKASYSLFNPLKSKAVNQEQSLKVLKDANIEGYSLHPSSNHQRGVYINNNTKDIVISHKGTTPTARSNILSDINIAFGNQSSTERFKRSVRKDKKIKDAFPNYNITLTGHSLGGSIGTNSATKNDMKGVFFNIGSGVPSLTSFIKDRRNINPDIKHYSTNYDPVSIQSKKYPIQQIKVKTKQGLNAHALENFI